MDADAGDGWNRADQLSILLGLRLGIITNPTTASLQVTKGPVRPLSRELSHRRLEENIGGRVILKCLPRKAKRKRINYGNKGLEKQRDTC